MSIHIYSFKNLSNPVQRAEDWGSNALYAFLSRTEKAGDDLSMLYASLGAKRIKLSPLYLLYSHQTHGCLKYLACSQITENMAEKVSMVFLFFFYQIPENVFSFISLTHPVDVWCAETATLTLPFPGKVLFHCHLLLSHKHTHFRYDRLPDWC